MPRGIPSAAWIFAALLLMSSLLLLPMLQLPQGVWYMGMQAYRYPYLLDGFKAAFVAGQLYPRWLPELMGGYGYPTFIYYPPGFWFLALPFSLVFETTIAVRVAMLCIALAGSAGAYLLCRQVGLNRAYALLCAAIFMAAPHALFQLYARGSLSEWMGEALLPWALLCYCRLVDASCKRHAVLCPALLLGIIGAVTLYAHPVVAIWLALALAVSALGLLVLLPEKRRFCAGMLGALLIALALSSPYWATFAMLQNAVGAGGFNKAYNMLQPGTYDLMQIPFLLPAIVGFWSARKQLLARACMLALLPLLYIISTQWTHLPTLVPYPSRSVNMLVALQLVGVLLFCLYVQQRAGRFTQYATFAVLLTLLVFCAYPQYGIRVLDESYGAERYPQFASQRVMDYSAFRAQTVAQFEDMTHLNEFMPKGAGTIGLAPRAGQKPLVEFLSRHADAQMDVISQHDDDVQVCVTSAGIVHINQFWFPGWRANIDGVDIAPYALENGQLQPVKPVIKGRNGLIDVLLNEKGRRQCLRIWYDAPSSWLQRNIAAALVLAATLALLAWVDRRQAR